MESQFSVIELAILFQNGGSQNLFCGHAASTGVITTVFGQISKNIIKKLGVGIKYHRYFKELFSDVIFTKRMKQIQLYLPFFTHVSPRAATDIKPFQLLGWNVSFGGRKNQSNRCFINNYFNMLSSRTETR